MRNEVCASRLELGKAYRQVGETTQAIQVSEDLAEVQKRFDLDQSLTHLQLAIAYSKDGQRQEAIQYLGIEM